MRFPNNPISIGMEQNHLGIILEEYEKLEQSFNVVPPTGSLAELVTFNGNKKVPIHRWFNFKEGFSNKLVPWIMKELDIEVRSILDPFCGVGTSLLSFQLVNEKEDCRIEGIEVNPFIKFVADTKLSWHKCDSDKIEQLTEKISKPLTMIEKRRVKIPELTTIRNPKAFDNGSLKELLALRHRIEALGDSPEKKVLMLAWASAIETVSALRKDGRALRFTNKSEERQAIPAFKENALIIKTDIEQLSKTHKKTSHAKVRLGDGRNLRSFGFLNESFDLLCYSPPYPNNIDYSEIYKLELWLSGFIKTYSQFKNLRAKTFRSHPSIKFSDTSYIDKQSGFRSLKRIRKQLIENLPRDQWKLARERVIKGYLDDLFLALCEQKRVVKKGGSIICVVGNSLHGPENYPILIAADLFVAEIARRIGLHVEKIQVARQLKRRHLDTQFLRESIVFMKSLGSK